MRRSVRYVLIVAVLAAVTYVFNPAPYGFVLGAVYFTVASLSLGMVNYAARRRSKGDESSYRWAIFDHIARSFPDLKPLTKSYDSALKRMEGYLAKLKDTMDDEQKTPLYLGIADSSVELVGIVAKLTESMDGDTTEEDIAELKNGLAEVRSPKEKIYWLSQHKDRIARAYAEFNEAITNHGVSAIIPAPRVIQIIVAATLV